MTLLDVFSRRPVFRPALRARRVRGFSLPELLAVAIAVLLALASCRDRDKGPVVIVDPGPPFPPYGKGRPTVRAAVELLDGTILLIMERRVP